MLNNCKLNTSSFVFFIKDSTAIRAHQQTLEEQVKENRKQKQIEIVEEEKHLSSLKQVTKIFETFVLYKQNQSVLTFFCSAKKVKVIIAYMNNEIMKFDYEKWK